MREVVDAKLGTLKLTRGQTARLRRITTQLAALGPCLQGSLVVRPGTCGKPTCACHADPPRLHGPYRSWTRKVSGKTVTRTLTDDELDDIRDYFDNDRRLRDLVNQLRALTTEIVENRLQSSPEHRTHRRG